MYKKITFTFLLLIAYLFICNKIYTKYTQEKQNKTYQHTSVEKTKLTNNTNQEIKYTPLKDTSIGNLRISKINLNQKLYPINDKQNNIEKNVTILTHSEEPSIENSIMFIAAHSGTGPLAYFKKLNKLEKNDLIELTYKNIKYIYNVKDIWEIKKNGSISVHKENTNQLILTTCSPTNDNNQLIINSVLLKKES